MKLLIIGNGFDKKCGLNSSFNDYLSSLENKLTHFKSSLNNLHAGSLYLYYLDMGGTADNLFIERYMLVLREKKLLWSDVENHIFNLLQNEVYSIDKVASYMERMHQKTEGIFFNSKSNNMIDILSCMVYYEFKIFVPRFGKLERNEANVYEVLFQKIKEFETRFSEYLNSELEKERNHYNLKVIQFYKKLTSNKASRVLSFNYTTPNILGVEIEHVHGSLKNNNIIIGIDSTKLKYEDASFRFSKTYRKVEQFVENPKKKIVDVLKGGCVEIIFYGHSLNEQDYAYFQTIFDKYELYDTELKLSFYYSVYSEPEKNKIKESQVKAVVKLIQTYGQSIDNEYRGGNLLHKLLNEQRLQIREIE